MWHRRSELYLWPRQSSSGLQLLATHHCYLRERHLLRSHLRGRTGSACVWLKVRRSLLWPDVHETATLHKPRRSLLCCAADVKEAESATSNEASSGPEWVPVCLPEELPKGEAVAHTLLSSPPHLATVARVGLTPSLTRWMQGHARRLR